MLFYYCYLILSHRSFCRAPSLSHISRLLQGVQEVAGVGSRAPQGFGVLSQGQGSVALTSWWASFSPPFSASHGGRMLLLAFLPIRSLRQQSDPKPGILKTRCSSSCTGQGGNNNLEVLPKYLPRPADSRYCCPGVGLEFGGLDSVPLILMSWILMQHLLWSKLVVFLLLPLEWHHV